MKLHLLLRIPRTLMIPDVPSSTTKRLTVGVLNETQKLQNSCYEICHRMNCNHLTRFCCYQASASAVLSIWC